MTADDGYFECLVCSYGTNNARRADDHADETGHHIEESQS